MKQRCTNPGKTGYKNYGGRGIKVCKHWEKFENFRDDMLSTYKKGLQIDRIDNDGDYKPTNCRWVTRTENVRNARSNVRHKGLCLAEWAEKLNVPYTVLHTRMWRNTNRSLAKAIESFKAKPYKPMKPDKQAHSSPAPTDE